VHVGRPETAAANPIGAIKYDFEIQKLRRLCEMRTGSNFLEKQPERLLDGITCPGRRSTRNFIGYPKAQRILGVDQETRNDESRPAKFAWPRYRGQDKGIGGFRYFSQPRHRACWTRC